MNYRAFIKSILGKVIGGLVGMLILGPVGLIIGLFLGHLYDRSRLGWLPTDRAERVIFLDNFFKLQGFVAKLDGRISQPEIQMAAQFMLNLHLSDAEVLVARDSFSKGKEPNFNWESAISEVKQLQGGLKTRWSAFFMNAQIQMLYADGVVRESAKPILQKMANLLGLPTPNFAYYDMIFAWHDFYQRAQSQYQSYQQSGSSGYSQQPFKQPGMSLSSAYELLKIEASAEDAEVKKAYRKMMSRFHPDKLVSQGLSEKEMKQATERVQKIQAAYEMIRQSRGF